MLALDSSANVVEYFEVYELFQPVSFGETFDSAGAMLENSPDKIARYTDIQNAIGPVGQKINIAACHLAIMEDVDGRDKPGHDEPK